MTRLQPHSTEVSPSSQASEFINIQTQKQEKQKQKSSKPRQRQRQQTLSVATVTITTTLPSNPDNEPATITQSLAMATPARLLVCSIGNPSPYLNTLHSAGHTVLSALAKSLSYPAFQKSRSHGNGMLSSGAEFTLWQSMSLMNVSGTGVSAAWKTFLRENQHGGGEPRLVVVHDELELPLGEIKVKAGASSVKGHNGLKSIREKLGGNDNMQWMRIGVGIGRPESRDPGVVAAYVLRKMSAGEKAKLEGTVSRVEVELMRLKEE